MPQSSYPLDITAATSGQVVDARKWSGRYIASEDIPAGRVVALHTDGQLRLPRSGDKILGVTPYRASMDPGGYKTGDQIAVLREGQAWVETNGAAPTATALQNPKLYASTTIATNRGKVTSDAVNAGAGVEVVALTPGVECVKTQAAATSPFSLASSALALLAFDFSAN